MYMNIYEAATYTELTVGPEGGQLNSDHSNGCSVPWQEMYTLLGSLSITF